MNFEKEKISVFYKRLLRLYPRDFRKRFGESMQQTFNDVCNEQQSSAGKVSITFVFSTFAETFGGIIEENLSELKGVFMNNLISTVWRRIVASVVCGLFATMPFVIMEWVYSSGFPQGVPFAIFNVLFIESSIFFFLLFSLFQTPYKNPIKEWILSFMLKIFVAVPLVLSWTFIVSDQMPCFLGGKGC